MEEEKAGERRRANSEDRWPGGELQINLSPNDLSEEQEEGNSHFSWLTAGLKSPNQGLKGRDTFKINKEKLPQSSTLN